MIDIVLENILSAEVETSSDGTAGVLLSDGRNSIRIETRTLDLAEKLAAIFNDRDTTTAGL